MKSPSARSSAGQSIGLRSQCGASQNPNGCPKCAERAEINARIGEGNRGEKNGRTKLTEKQARQLLRLSRTGVSPEKLAVKFGITSRSVRLIRDGYRWAHLSHGGGAN
jgi:hypothetical protein